MVERGQKALQLGVSIAVLGLAGLGWLQWRRSSKDPVTPVHTLSVERESAEVRLDLPPPSDPSARREDPLQPEPGHRITGRVVNEQGVPVAGVRVALENFPLQMSSGMRQDFIIDPSGPDGRFELATRYPAGTWSVRARRRGMKQVSPDTVTVPATGGVEPITVRMRAMPSITGVVVDDRGEPQPDVGISAELDRSGEVAGESDRTDEQGYFELYALEDDSSAVRLRLWNTGPCEFPTDDGPAYDWGARGVRIVLLRGVSFELTVVDGASGAPVESFSVACWPEKSRGNADSFPRLAGAHHDGKVTVGVQRGRNQLVVLPTDPWLVSNRPLAFEAVASMAPIQIALERLAPQRIRVTTQSDGPVLRTRLELVRLGSESLEWDSIMSTPSGVAWSGDPNHRFHTLLSDVVTDERGEAEVKIIPDNSELGLRVSGPRHLPRILSPLRLPPAGEMLAVVVETGGRVAGSVANVGYAMERIRLRLVLTGDERRRQSTSVRLRADGSFESPSLAPGEYSVQLTLSFTNQKLVVRSERIALEPALATVVIGDGTTEIALDASAFAPGSISGHAWLDGVVPAGCRVVAERHSESRRSEPARFGHFLPDPDGRFEALDLPPGDYRIGIVVGDLRTAAGDVFLSDETVHLAPGQVIERDFRIERPLR